MDWYHIIQAVLSLIFVIGLLLLTLWVFKYCELKGLKCKWVKSLKSGQRLEVVELRRIDARNSIAVIRRDDREYTILLSNSANLLLDTSVSGSQNHD